MLLTEIGKKYNTDKATYHNFTWIYEKLFSELKDSVNKILEIGTYRGGSIRMWREYFPNAIIHGADLKPEYGVSGERIVFHLVDQGSRVSLEASIPNEEFDIIIDDGSHQNDHQMTTLSCLFDRVKSGGFYIIEDVHAGTETRRAFCRFLMDNEFKTELLSDGECERIQSEINDVTFFFNRCPGISIVNGDSKTLILRKR